MTSRKQRAKKVVAPVVTEPAAKLEPEESLSKRDEGSPDDVASEGENLPAETAAKKGAKPKVFYVNPRHGRPGQWMIQVRVNGVTKPACERKLYKHLDGQPKHNVLYWVSQNLTHPEPQPRTDLRLSKLVDEFVDFYREKKDWKGEVGGDDGEEKSFDKTKASGTLAEHKRHLLNSVIPYYLSLTPPRTDPNYWPEHSVDMYDALKKLGHSKHQVFRANCALRVFWSWLQLKRIVSRDTMLFTRNPDMGQADDDTPMERVITPEEALALAKKHAKERPDLARYILLSMFFSLRPQECFGVRAGDFRAGELATEFGCSKIMVGFGQFGRYVVYVGRQRTKTMSYRPPKKGSRGWVACFNKEAAKLLHSLIGDDTAPESHVMQCTPNEFYTAWRDNWEMDFAPKDLRRSSLTHLGLTVGFGMLQLMAHARQRTAKSLLRYLRSPDNKAKKAPLPKASDFDDGEDADGKTDDMDSAS